jgi:hypothetical protein
VTTLTSRSISPPFLTTSTSKVLAGVLGINLRNDGFCRLLGEQRCLLSAFDEARVGATVWIGGNGDAATPALRGATNRRMAGKAAIMASSCAHAVGVPRRGRARHGHHLSR